MGKMGCLYQIYIGTFKDGYPSGQGTWYFKEGSDKKKYVGEFLCQY